MRKFIIVFVVLSCLVLCVSASDVGSMFSLTGVHSWVVDNDDPDFSERYYSTHYIFGSDGSLSGSFSDRQSFYSSSISSYGFNYSTVNFTSLSSDSFGTGYLSFVISCRVDNFSSSQSSYLLDTSLDRSAVVTYRNNTTDTIDCIYSYNLSTGLLVYRWDVPCSDILIPWNLSFSNVFCPTGSYFDSLVSSQYQFIRTPSLSSNTAYFSSSVSFSPTIVIADTVQSILDNIISIHTDLSSYYGQLIGLCNNIYNQTLSINATTSAMSLVLDSLDSKLDSIDDNISSILSILNLGIVTSSDIDNSIATGVQLIESYYDDSWDTAVEHLDSDFDGDRIGETGSVISGIDTLDDYESSISSSVLEDFENISNYAELSGDALSGIHFVVTIFTRIFQSFGSYSIIFTFPLLIGLMTFVLGIGIRRANSISQIPNKVENARNDRAYKDALSRYGGERP